ncbi:hypothetical protein T03_4164 [Trichinella britovi]|uniref:Uncharacterized protein n=1 Tax=Trichinella britovi TaxID=45882 RepID=A0A0V1BEE1_TRIBR|nr:hypothetical protein T03_4164 [Trichinella britovi]
MRIIQSSQNEMERDSIFRYNLSDVKLCMIDPFVPSPFRPQQPYLVTLVIFSASKPRAWHPDLHHRLRPDVDRSHRSAQGGASTGTVHKLFKREFNTANAILIC